jgi:hypothetical protein
MAIYDMDEFSAGLLVKKGCPMNANFLDWGDQAR